MNFDILLNKVERAAEAIIKEADKHNGLFASIADRESGEMLQQVPGFDPWTPLWIEEKHGQSQYPPGGGVIRGQRNGDRAPRGCNLIHDESLLFTLYGLSDGLGKGVYADAADRYLRYFAQNCTRTESGLFPWGEHAYWDLNSHAVGEVWTPWIKKGIGNIHHKWTIHDHLRQVPVWLWDKLNEYDAGCVQRFADGLDQHWIRPERDCFCRHAHITVTEYVNFYNENFELDNGGSSDFPRHAGFYIMDLSYAYSKDPRKETLEQLHRFINHNWLYQRDERTGVLSMCRYHADPDGQSKSLTTCQTLSQGISLLESALIIEKQEPATARLMRERAEAYIDAFLGAPHVPEKGVFINNPLSGNGDIHSWGGMYGRVTLGSVAQYVLQGYRLTGDQRLLNWACSAGEIYFSESIPADEAIPVYDGGQVLGLLVDLYDITGQERWLDQAQVMAESLIPLFFDSTLPRCAIGAEIYDSQLVPGFFLHALSRLALMLKEGRDGNPLKADYTGR